MPRRAFMTDLKRLCKDPSVEGIGKVKPGPNHGEIIVRVEPPLEESFELFVTIPEIDEYPDGHWVQIEPVDRTLSDDVKSSLARIQDKCIGRDLDELLFEIAAQFVSSGSSDVEYEMSDVELNYALRAPHNRGPLQIGLTPPHPSTAVQRNRVRYDLQNAKDAGLRIGAPGGAETLFGHSNCYLSLAIRMSDLGISSEAQRAWQVQPSEYLTLLIRYNNGYRTLEEILETPFASLKHSISFRVGKSSSYKPDLQEVTAAFRELSTTSKQDNKLYTADSLARNTAKFNSVFISRPMEQLMNERFVLICRYRMTGMSWSGAEKYLDLKQARLAGMEADEMITDEYMIDSEDRNTAYPSVVMADHVTDSLPGSALSLPLLAMQYLLRHFVRCTEFCLVCHNKLGNDLQAIMPYVCDRPLCLHQFMTLGFGPSLEHDICVGENVVDLLVSFCYVSCQQRKLDDLPKGLNWQVPSPDTYNRAFVPSLQSTGISTESKYDLSWVDINACEIMFLSGVPRPVKAGDWVVLQTCSNADDQNKSSVEWMHCRIKEVNFYPLVKVSKPILEAGVSFNALTKANAHVNSAAQNFQYPPRKHPSVTTNTPTQNRIYSAILHKYEHNFENLQGQEQRDMLCHLLNTLPTVANMREWLTENRSLTLSHWSDRISPSALGALRWIIASCRACIVQDSIDERISGMPGWMQFRFAMGAPDKEKRFQSSVQRKRKQLKLQIPTIFAWHGSPLLNWHSIIRQGLNFNVVAHGRACGNGVYHSLDHAVSLQYTNSYSRGNAGSDSISIPSKWPFSKLDISAALALNEIVNAPTEFICSNPHLVLDKLDWIQTRYLFIQCNGKVEADLGANNAPRCALRKQDPRMTPRGVEGPLEIPDQSSQSLASNNKRVKAGNDSEFKLVQEQDTDDEDQAMLKPEAITPQSDASRDLSPKYAAPQKPTNLSPFEPGKLDYATLPVLAPPIWASPTASIRLMTDFQHVLKIQEYERLRGRLHELGWFTEPEKMDNVYQWIVELHSFESTLPLTQDMKRANCQSVVLELRFGKTYPMTPPFVRVIRPRFLPFSEGGGGNVTLGGAMCMELLTNTGWTAASTIESVLLQVRCAITAMDPPARLSSTSARADYGVGEAIEAYERACHAHGWEVPSDFREMAYGGIDTMQSRNHSNI